MDKHLQSSSLPPVRNPFKAPTKTDDSSEWKRLHGGKALPAGMKIKKRVSGEEEEKKRNGSTRTTEEEEEEEEEAEAEAEAEAGCQERSETDPSKSKSSPEGKESGRALSPSPKSDHEQTTEDPPPGAVSPLQSGPRKDGDKKRHSGKSRASDSDGKTRTRVASDPTAEAPRRHDSASGGRSSSSGVEKTQKTQKTKKTQPSSVRPDSPPSFAALADQCKPRSGAAPTNQHPQASPRDQPQRRSPIQLSDDDDDGGRQAEGGDDDDDDDDNVQVVSVQPGPKRSPPVPTAPVQKTLTSFFLPASQLKGQEKDPRALHSQLTAQLKQKKATLSVLNVSAIPDKRERLSQVKDLEDALDSLSLTPLTEPESLDEVKEEQKPSPVPSQSNPFGRPGGVILLPDALALSPHEATQMFGADPQSHTFYGGKMTKVRRVAIRNPTIDTINRLHKSLETCPGPDTETKDPKGIKVQLLPHQRRALAWLLWREDQKLCGGILADDMGLGKTLTMIALILAQKKPKDEKDPKLEGWISKHDSSVVASQGTLIICPASLVHHWKKEVERHIKNGRLSVYLYHGPNRQRNAEQLADYDVVVTTYSLVSKEIPVQKEEAERPSQDSDPVGANLPPLLRVAWARVVLDEAHNIKNPKVQKSMAVCKLRARARWAVTGTPIQNNLLDMYSLLKFLRCAPFDEYKLWKAQVDNGSRRGGERLHILTQTLMLRRTKDQQDSAGKPLVDLPDRSCEVHRVKLSEDEQSVYDVVFARSKSTLQSYLKTHEGKEGGRGDGSNPFDKVANEFGMSQQGAPSPPQQHIFSILLRLRQCCCHLSLLKKSLEEQLNALSLSGPSDPNLKDTVCLNGSRFRSILFEETRGSTKLSAVLTELKEIRTKDQKSVIVSQWTGMLHIVALHLEKMGLRFAVIDGTVNIKKRMDLVEEFNTNPRGPEVMLVSLCAGAVGLNLTGGNHLFFIDMHWNPALEDQVCDRIYRVGQHRDVTIHKFICEGTVEDKISSLQEKKRELAHKVLNDKKYIFTNHSLDNLRVIFQV